MMFLMHLKWNRTWLSSSTPDSNLFRVLLKNLETYASFEVFALNIKNLMLIYSAEHESVRLKQWKIL